MSDFDGDEVERLTVGTVGEPGQRLFLLQARAGARLLTLKLEKGQVASLAQHLAELLADLPEPDAATDAPELEEPAEPAWAVGTMGLGYDEEADRVMIVAYEAVGPDDEPGATARVLVTRQQAAAVAARGAELVVAGRPQCPLCGYPLDPSGHVCPRTNGHRPPTL